MLSRDIEPEWIALFDFLGISMNESDKPSTQHMLEDLNNQKNGTENSTNK